MAQADRTAPEVAAKFSMANIVRGSDGELLYDVSFFQDEVFKGDTADSLGVFHELVERFREGYLAILIPRERIESRYLFTE